MKFVQILINFPGADKPYVLGCAFDDDDWRHLPDDADLLDGWMADNLERNVGALDLLCSDGIHRRIGATLLATAIMEYQIVEMPAQEMPVQEMPAAEEMRDAA